MMRPEYGYAMKGCKVRAQLHPLGVSNLLSHFVSERRCCEDMAGTLGVGM